MLTSSEANRSNRSETDETRKNGVLLGLIRAVSSPKYIFFFFSLIVACFLKQYL
jgi:threonine/homoserine/homoserine lactone efflux protein